MSKHHTNTRNMQKVKAAFRAECEAADAKCWLCGMPINYAERGKDDSFELDHYFPASTHPEHYEDPANFRPSNASCNRERSNKPPRPGLGTLSRQWL